MSERPLTCSSCGLAHGTHRYDCPVSTLSEEAPADLGEIVAFVQTVRGGGGGYSNDIIARLCDYADQLLRERTSRQDKSPQRSALFDRLAGLRDDWDGSGAKAPDARAIDSAKRVLAAVEAPVSVVPRTNGGVQIEWHRGGVDVEISIEPHGGNQFFLEDGEPTAFAAGWAARDAQCPPICPTRDESVAAQLAEDLAGHTQSVSGNEGSDTPNDRALHRLAELLASCDDHGWSSNGVFSATLPTRSAAREIAEIVDALVDSASTPAPACTSRNPSPLA